MDEAITNRLEHVLDNSEYSVLIAKLCAAMAVFFKGSLTAEKISQVREFTYGAACEVLKHDPLVAELTAKIGKAETRAGELQLQVWDLETALKQAYARPQGLAKAEPSSNDCGTTLNRDGNHGVT